MRDAEHRIGQPARQVRLCGLRELCGLRGLCALRALAGRRRVPTHTRTATSPTASNTSATHITDSAPSSGPPMLAGELEHSSIAQHLRAAHVDRRAANCRTGVLNRR